MQSAVPVAVDGRTGKRFPVQLPIRIHLWDCEDERAGMTANVSASGVYLHAGAAGESQESTELWRPGSTVEFEIMLPTGVTGCNDDIRIHCRGRVVRVETQKTGESGKGLACVIDKYEFVRNPKNHAKADIG
jgi:hypothetical protein